jgi:hypothetical protein
VNEPNDEPIYDYWRGYIMGADKILDLTKQEIHPEILTMEPTGNIIHVLLEVEPDQFGHIILPKGGMDFGTREKMGTGYIIAAGPMAGNLGYQIPGPGVIGVTRATPEDLLGLHVIFGSSIGMPLRVSMLDREYKSSVIVMTSRDIRGVDLNPEPLTIRAERRSKE